MKRMLLRQDRAAFAALSGLPILVLLLCAGILSTFMLFTPRATATPASGDQPHASQLPSANSRTADVPAKPAITLVAATKQSPQNQPKEVSRSKNQPGVKSITVATRSLTHKDQLCSIMVNYPQVGNAKVDAELDFWAGKTVRTFISGISSIAGADGGRYSMLVDYDLTLASERFLSIVFRISTETGGPHPDSGMVTFTYDLTDGRKLGIQDIFDDSAGLLHFLSLYSYESLLTELGSAFENSIKHGTSPDFLNFSLFSLQPDGMTLYFPPYQVADYALGEKQVRVAAQKLQPYKPRPGVWAGSAGFEGKTQLGQLGQPGSSDRSGSGAYPSLYPK